MFTGWGVLGGGRSRRGWPGPPSRACPGAPRSPALAGGQRPAPSYLGASIALCVSAHPLPHRGQVLDTEKQNPNSRTSLGGFGLCRQSTDGAGQRDQDRGPHASFLRPCRGRTSWRCPSGVCPQGGNVVQAGAPGRLGHLRAACTACGPNVTVPQSSGCVAGKYTHHEAREKDNELHDRQGLYE